MKVQRISGNKINRPKELAIGDREKLLRYEILDLPLEIIDKISGIKIVKEKEVDEKTEHVVVKKKKEE